MYNDVMFDSFRQVLRNTTTFVGCGSSDFSLGSFSVYVFACKFAFADADAGSFSVPPELSLPRKPHHLYSRTTQDNSCT